MDLILIAAVSENNVIGKNGKVPWYIPEDIKHFKDLTLGHPVIMGRKTYESIPDKFRPLSGRKNIVLSKKFKSNEGIHVAKNIQEALGFTEEKDTYVIGGGETYRLFLPRANKIELTLVHASYDGDAFFPYINWDDWKLMNEKKGMGRGGLEYSFMSYEKR